MSAAPLTDRCVTELTLKWENDPKQWKTKCCELNEVLLKWDDFVEEVKSLMMEMKNHKETDSYCRKREYLKHMVRNPSIKFSKARCKQQKENEFQLVQQMNQYCRKSELSEEDKMKLASSQPNEFNQLFTQRAQGASIRSRAKWIEQGEKNWSYFFILERRRQERNQINVLMVNNVECSDD